MSCPPPPPGEGETTVKSSGNSSASLPRLAADDCCMTADAVWAQHERCGSIFERKNYALLGCDGGATAIPQGAQQCLMDIFELDGGHPLRVEKPRTALQCPQLRVGVQASLHYRLPPAGCLITTTSLAG